MKKVFGYFWATHPQGLLLRKLSPGAEYFGSCRCFAPENCGNQSINTPMVQDVLKNDDWLKQLTTEDYRGLKTHSSIGDVPI